MPIFLLYEGGIAAKPAPGAPDAVRHHDCITSLEGPGPRILKAAGGNESSHNTYDIEGYAQRTAFRGVAHYRRI